MTVTSLRAVVDESFVLRFAGLAQSGSSNQSLAKALKGEGGGNKIETGLRFGARTFATAVQALNSGIAVLNISQSTLTGLGKLTDDMIALADEASQSTTSSQARRRLDLEFKQLGNKFQEVVDEAKLGETEYLTVDGLSHMLTNLGLDENTSDSIAAVFKKFVVPDGDDTLASEETKGARPVRIPAGAYTTPVTVARTSKEYEEIFDGTVDLTTRPGAYQLLNDLKGLKGQIEDNLSALDNAVTVVGQNIDLVRAAGLAFLDISDKIGSETDADAIATQLRDRIRKDAPAALAQAENLIPIVIAALAFDSSALTESDK